MSADDLARRSAEAMFERDRASQGLGMLLEEVREGYARLSMTVRGDMLNGYGACHGGFIFALADFGLRLLLQQPQPGHRRRRRRHRISGPWPGGRRARRRRRRSVRSAAGSESTTSPSGARTAAPSPCSAAAPTASRGASSKGSQCHEGRLHLRRGPHPGRPLWRQPRRRPRGRSRCHPDPRAGPPQPGRGLGRRRRRGLWLRQPGRRGQPQRRAHERAPGRPPDRRPRHHRQPPVRLRHGRHRHGRPGHPHRRGRADARRRCREHEPRPVRHGQGRDRLFPRRPPLRHHHRLALRQPSAPRRVRHRFDAADRGQRRRRLRRHPRRSGRLRPALAAALGRRRRGGLLRR